MPNSQDHDDLSVLFGRHLPWLKEQIKRRMGHDLRRREGVSDIAQSVCREILKDQDDYQFESDRSFRNLLFGQAIYKLLDRGRFHSRPMRNVRREVAIETLGQDDSDTILDPGEDARPVDIAIQQEQIDMLRRAVDQLPDDQKLAISGHLAGLTSAEIGARLERSAEAIRSLRRRALANLSRVFGATRDK